MQYICDILHIIHLELPVNLTSSTSVVQIHLFPPQWNNTNTEKAFVLFFSIDYFGLILPRKK